MKTTNVPRAKILASLKSGQLLRSRGAQSAPVKKGQSVYTTWRYICQTDKLGPGVTLPFQMKGPFLLSFGNPPNKMPVSVFKSPTLRSLWCFIRPGYIIPRDKSERLHLWSLLYAFPRSVVPKVLLPPTHVANVGQPPPFSDGAHIDFLAPPRGNVSLFRTIAAILRRSSDGLRRRRTSWPSASSACGRPRCRPGRRGHRRRRWAGSRSATAPPAGRASCRASGC